MPSTSRTTIPMGKMTLEEGNALLIVDLQRDFLPGGALAVADGDAVVPIVNRYLAAWSAHGMPVFLSRCWHPPDHCSFRARGGPWPPHCVAGTPGAELAPGLEIPADAVVVSKATDPDREAYSAFDGTDLDAGLRRLGTTQLFIGGLATDYSVLATVRHAIEHGFTAIVLRDAIRALEAAPGDGAAAERTMDELGARLVALETLGL